MDNGMFSQVKGWSKQPFSANMNLTHWVLFLMLAVAVAVFWTRILKHITE